MTAPIALFVYNRPFHSKKTVEALKSNHLAKDSNLFIFSDGWKGADDKDSVQKVREYIKKVEGFKKVQIIESDSNLGLSRSIITGVTNLTNEYGRCIILEDDIITSTIFLNYMNFYLDKYSSDDRVGSIHGYSYPVANLPELYFLKGADCWGWATWKRSWAHFEVDGSTLMAQLKKRKLIRDINYNNSYPFYEMLKRQVKGEIDSWAIRWHASLFLKNKLTLYPGKSLVKNIGLDSSGTHCNKTSEYDIDELCNEIRLHTIEPAESFFARDQIEKFLKERNNISPFKRFYNLTKKVLKL